VKTILKSRITREKQIHRIGVERRVLMDASDHPFISRMHYAFQNHRQLFFVLDFCAGGDLYYHLSRMKNSRFKHFRLLPWLPPCLLVAVLPFCCLELERQSQLVATAHHPPRPPTHFC